MSITDKPKYGSKSSPDPEKRHFFKWNGEKSGEGIGTCMHCGLQMKFEENGTRGGKHRVYKKKGERAWSEKETQCVARSRSLALAAKEPKPAKKASKKAA